MERPFAELLRDYRLAAGLTQEALAERAGLGVRSIQALERGQNRPQRDTLRRLADALALEEAARARFTAAGTPAPRMSSGGGSGLDASLGYSLPRSLSRPIGREVAQSSVLAAATAPPAEPVPRGGAPAAALGLPAWPQPVAPATTLVGRAREMTLLDRHLAGQGTPLLLLTGQPGIGKSRLLQEAAERATAQGRRVLAGGCTRGAGQQPFAPLLQAFQHHLAARTGAERRLDLRGCAWLVRLLPELAADEIEPLPGWTLAPAQERRLMFDAVRRFLANVAGPAGTLLLLDDLHWAGADAFDLLAGVLYQLPAAPFSVVGAARDTDVPSEHPLSLTIADLAEAQLVTSHLVRPLAPPEAQALFVQLLDEQQEGAALAARVAQQTGGVPFFLVSYARGLEGQDSGDEPAPDVPWDVRQSIVRRVSALPETARALLAATAVVGRVAPRTLLLAVLEQPEREVLSALEGACRAGLLEEVGEDAYGFVHDVIREVVEAELGLARRRLLHRQVAEALERAPWQAPVEALAYHFRQAGEPARAAVYLEQAGDLAAAQFAHVAAADHYRDLVACLKGLGRASDHLRAREKLARVLSLMGQFDAALAVLEQVVETYRASANATEVGRIEADIAATYGLKGAFAAGAARLQPVVTALESGGPGTALASAYLILGVLLSSSGQAERGLVAAQRAVEIARAANERDLLATVQKWTAFVLLMLNRADEALQAIEDAARVSESGDDWEILGHMAWICEERGEYEQGRQAAERERALAERARDPGGMIHSMSRLGLSAFLSGDWPGARAYLERGIAISRQVGFTSGPSYATPHIDMGRLLHAEGVWDEATQHFEAVLARYVGLGEHVLTLVAHGHLAERDVLTGNPEAAQERLMAVLDTPGHEERVVTQYILPVLALAQYELGDLHRAAATAVETIRRARSGTCRLALVQALRVQALVLLARERHDDAVRSLEEGLAVARGMPYPHGEGRLLHAYGLLHARQGDHAAARECLDAALAIFRRLGARADVEQVELVLSDLG